MHCGTVAILNLNNSSEIAMSFTQDDVKKLAHLARLASNENSFDHSIAEDLSNILRLLNQISEINTENIQPMAHSQKVALRCRPDVVTETNVRESMQKLVPSEATAAGLYLVEKVVE